MEMPDEIASRLMDFHLCPNTGRVLDGTPGDDKVICGCGKSNPSLVSMGHSEGIDRGGLVHHVKRFLIAATIADYRAQRDK
jgi:hypothetical protein